MQTKKVKDFLEKLKNIDEEIFKLMSKKDEVTAEYDKAVIESEKEKPTHVEVQKAEQELTRKRLEAKVEKEKAVEKALSKPKKVKKVNEIKDEDSE